MYIMTLKFALIVIRLVLKYIDRCHLVCMSAEVLLSLRHGITVVTLNTRMLNIINTVQDLKYISLQNSAADRLMCHEGLINHIW